MIYFFFPLVFICGHPDMNGVKFLVEGHNQILKIEGHLKRQNKQAVKKNSLPGKEKDKILRNFASKLNEDWKYDTNGEILRFIISKKNFKGQLVYYEVIQQVPPLPVKLCVTDSGTINLLKLYSPEQTDTLAINLVDNSLIFENKTFTKIRTMIR